MRLDERTFICYRDTIIMPHSLPILIGPSKVIIAAVQKKDWVFNL